MNSRAGFFGIFIVYILFIFGCREDSDLYENTNYPENARLKQVQLLATIDSEAFWYTIHEYTYDEQGRISKRSSPKYDSSVIVGISHYSLYEYNSDNQLLKICSYNANINSPNGFINLENHLFEYSPKGLKIKETIEYPQNSSSESTSFQYDDQNRLSRTEKYDQENKMTTYTIHSYNRSGRMDEETTYTSKDEKILITKHEYTNKLLTKTSVYGGRDFELLREIKQTYDKAGNLIGLESDEISPFSSQSSYTLRYVYFE